MKNHNHSLKLSDFQENEVTYLISKRNNLESDPNLAYRGYLFLSCWSGNWLCNLPKIMHNAFSLQPKLFDEFIDNNLLVIPFQFLEGSPVAFRDQLLHTRLVYENPDTVGFITIFHAIRINDIESRIEIYFSDYIKDLCYSYIVDSSKNFNVIAFKLLIIFSSDRHVEVENKHYNRTHIKK